MTGGRDVGGGKDLSYEAESLASFKRRIDEILGELPSSPASHQHISDQDITPDAYGTGFSAAADLSSLYDRVHTRLQDLSRLFGEQLEALGIATQIVDRGYQNLETDQAQRFQTIQERVEEYSQSRHGDGNSQDIEAGQTDKANENVSDYR
ncbi:hypothetical protein F0L17_10965 [Streptomyces sp. TRM43335]|uniref:Uncharacterized protein n=1 Tax=Streptomyces taklimakanensis TaxID=2569853 RepID=A0A6G2BBK6_9ACTN|nr:hypothetical protein [Streptomyces taklimakanensis]MTE19640.1 hypothetical protein [Streptomyces taklimakanensis]